MILLTRCAYATLVLLQFLLMQGDAVDMVILLVQFASVTLAFAFAPPLIYRTPSIQGMQKQALQHVPCII